jgi:hypothetical protein
MKKRIFALAIALTMMFSLMPVIMVSATGEKHELYLDFMGATLNAENFIGELNVSLPELDLPWPTVNLLVYLLENEDDNHSFTLTFDKEIGGREIKFIHGIHYESRDLLPPRPTNNYVPRSVTAFRGTPDEIFGFEISRPGFRVDWFEIGYFDAIPFGADDDWAFEEYEEYWDPHYWTSFGAWGFIILTPSMAADFLETGIFKAESRIQTETWQIETVVTELGVPGLRELILAAAPIAIPEVQIEAANNLFELGLFKGTGIDEGGNPIFELNRAPTRYESIVMLIRLLGKEAEALAGEWDMPFTDVASWAEPYVGYAFANGLTTGTSATAFSGDNLINASSYLTFVLRALGYDDRAGDFAWDKAWAFSDELGITGGEYDEATNAAFLRGNAALVSFDALSANMAGLDTTLADMLVAAGVFTEEAAEAVGLTIG